jgi:hypothetical protein
MRYRLMALNRRAHGLPPLPVPGAPPGRYPVQNRPPAVRLPAGYHQRAGGWLAAPRLPVMRASPAPLGAFTAQRRTTDIGPDGIGAPVTFSAAGTATVQVGPSGLGATWTLDQAFLQTSVGQLDPATCVLFAGPGAMPDWEVASGLAGGGSQFGLGGVGLVVGEFVIAQWSGGTPGAVARLRVTGTKTVLVSL